MNKHQSRNKGKIHLHLSFSYLLFKSPSLSVNGIQPQWTSSCQTWNISICWLLFMSANPHQRLHSYSTPQISCLPAGQEGPLPRPPPVQDIRCCSAGCLHITRLSKWKSFFYYHQKHATFFIAGFQPVFTAHQSNNSYWACQKCFSLIRYVTKHATLIRLQ